MPQKPRMLPPQKRAHFASLSSTPSACRFSNARTMVSAGGADSHSKRMMLSMPRALS